MTKVPLRIGVGLFLVVGVLLSLALSGNLSEKMIGVVLCIAGVLTATFSRSIASWASQVGERGGLEFERWRGTTTLSVALGGAGLVVLGVAQIFANAV